VNAVRVFLSLRFEQGRFCVVICRFNFCRQFCGKSLFLAISYINSHFFSGANGREYIVKIYLKAAILCSVGWFQRKLIVMSVVIGLRYMSFSMFV
jgi:hypothetical protein